jgi:hypothetical protein
MKGVYEVDIRDRVMAKIISQVVRGHSNKVLVLIGAAHVNLERDYAVEYQPYILENSFGIKSATFKVEELNNISTSYHPKPGGPYVPFDPESPLWVREKQLIANTSVLRKTFINVKAPTNLTFLPTPRSGAGFDGFIFIDQLNSDREQ